MKRIYFSLIAIFIFCSGSFINATVYYLQATGNVNAVTSWGTATDGSGTAPGNFSTAGDIFHFANRSNFSYANQAPSFLGTQTVVIDINTMTVTGTASFGSAKIDISANCSLTLSKSLTLNLNALDLASTIVYNFAGLQPKGTVIYGNVTIATSTSLDNSNGDIHVGGLLTIDASQVLTMNGAVLFLEGTAGSIAGSGAISSGTAASIAFANGNGGNNGTLTFQSGGQQMLVFDENYSSGANYITLGSDLTIVSGFFSQGTGGFDLNGHTLTIDNLSDASFPSSSANGVLKASGSSVLDIQAATLGGANATTIFMDATNNTLSTLTFNKTGKTLTINGTLNVTSALNVAAGTLVLTNSGTSTIDDVTLSGGNLTLSSGTMYNFTDLNLNSAGTVLVSGGAVSITNSLNILAGTMTINSSGSSSTADKVTVNGGVLTLTSGTLNVTDFVDVKASSTFNAGNNQLILKANSTRTARLGEIIGTFNNTSITVESYAEGPTTGWATLGVNGVDGNTIGNWETQIPMTCTGCIYDASTMGGFVSIQGWDASGNDYVTTLGPSDVLSPGKGFWVYLGTGQSTTTPMTWAFSGAAVKGATTIPVESGGAVEDLIANPYPSPISWSLVATLNNISSGEGPVYGYNAEGGAVSTYIAGGASQNPNGIGDVIPTGQGFYFDGSVDFVTSLSFNESVKSTANTQTSNPLIKGTDVAKTEAQLKIMRLKISGANDEKDYALFDIRDNTSLYKGKWDARKIFQTPGYQGFPGPYTKYTTISSKDPAGADLAINAFPPSSGKVNIPVLVKVSTTGTYTLSAQDYDNWSSCIIIRDKLNNSFHDLTKGEYIFTISDTTSAPRFELMVCENGASSTVSIKELNEENKVFIGQDRNGAFVTTNFEQNTKAVISVYNIIGQQLIRDIAIEGTETNTRLNLNLNEQVVIVKVTTDKEVITKKVVVH